MAKMVTEMNARQIFREMCEHAEQIAEIVKTKYGLEDSADLCLYELEEEDKRPNDQLPRSDEEIARDVAQRIEQP